MIKSALQSSLINDVKHRSMSAGAVPSSEYLIETIVVGSTPVTAVEFLNLGQWAGIYRHLQIVASVRGTSSGNLRMFLMDFNGDTAANYMSHALYSDGPGSINDGTKTSMWWSYGSTGGSPTNAFGTIVTDILDPFQTTKNKTIRSFGGGPNGYNMVNLVSGHWRNTAAVTSIRLTAQGGDSYATGSRISLYGVN